jgi:hypothetical protein
LPENPGGLLIKKIRRRRLFLGAIHAHLRRIRRLGIEPGHKKRERAAPMLAKRLIVAAFAAAVVIGAPFAFPGQSDLFTDTPPGLMTRLASN